MNKKNKRIIQIVVGILIAAIVLTYSVSFFLYLM